MDRLLTTIWTALPLRQLAIVAALTLLLLVGLSFSRIAIADHQVQVQKQQLEVQVETLKVENQKLQAEIATAQTDAAIEALARRDLGWTKPGDVAVVIIRSTPTPSVLPTPTRVAGSTG